MNIKEYIESKLNEEQTKAALHTDTPSLIIAGAGSGKTRVLTYKIAYLIKGLGCPVQRILGVTFTNKAANEMKERLVQIFEDLEKEHIVGYNEETQNDEENTSDSVLDFIEEMNRTSNLKPSKKISTNDLKWIGTFHSIFLKILKEDIEGLGKKYDKNFSIIDTKDRDSLLREILKKLNLKDQFQEKEVSAFISKQKNAGFTARDFKSEATNDYEGSMVQIYEEYEKRMETSNTLDFDDLLLFPLILFKSRPDILEKWQNHFDYILVDEAQDTNGVQFELAKMLSRNGTPITLIGDDFQSIYKRRGAVMENFLHVDKYRSDIEIFKLQMNYRSRAHIVNLGNDVIKKNTNQYEKNIIAHREGNDKVRCFIHRSDIDEAANLLEFIKKLKEKERVKHYGDIAILYRRNAQSVPFEKICVQEGIPYLIHGSFKFFERKEIKDILAYLTFFINPKDSLSLRRIINVPNRKVGDTTMGKIIFYAEEHGNSLYETIYAMRNGTIPTSELKVTPQALNGVKNFILAMEDLKTKLPNLKPKEFIEELVKKIHYRDYLIQEEGNEEAADERYENIGQLMNLAEKSLEPGIEGLEQFMEEVSLMTSDDNDDDNSDKIQLMTIHSSKGLEFPVVFIVGLEEGVFPGKQAQSDYQELEEERRLMYVAVTRAKDHLFLSAAQSRMEYGQEKCYPLSEFLEDLPEDKIEKLMLTNGGGYESDSGSRNTEEFNENDRIQHTLFGPGRILEVRDRFAVVVFDNPKLGTRKTETRFLKKV